MIKCPQCGYSEVVQGNQKSNVMNEYYNKDNPKDIAVFNSNENKIEVKNDKGVVEFTYIKKGVVIAPVTPSPVPAKPVVTTK